MTQDDLSKRETKSTKRQESLAGRILTTQATLVAWLVFLGFGSAVLASYYAHLHYLPELKWEEAFAYLMAMTVLGGGLVAVYVLLLYLPGWIWSEFLIFDSELQRGPLCYLGGPDGKPEPCFLSIGQHLVLPFAVLMVAIHFAMIAGGGPLLATAIVGLTGLIWYSYCEFKCVLEVKTLITQAPRQSLLLKYTTTSGVAAFMSIVSLFILYYLIDPRGRHWSLLAICTVAVIVSNLLVAVQFRYKPTRAVLTGIISAITLLICGEILPDVGQTQSERILMTFGIGDKFLKVKLDVTDEGRKMLIESGLLIDDDVRVDKNSFTAELVLLSRLGDEYLVGKEAVGTIWPVRVALPKNMVKSWSSEELCPSLDCDGASSPTMKPYRWVAVFASSFLVILIWALHPIQARSQTRREAALWAAFRAGRTRIVTGRDGEACRIGLGDAMAVEEIQGFFARLKFPKPEQIYADRLTEKDLSSNLIVLGGPDANEISKSLSAGIDATMFGIGNFFGSTVLDFQEQKIFQPSWVDHARDVFHDYVLIYRMNSPFNWKAQILLISGSPGYGSWAGIRHLFSESFLGSDVSEKQGPFELLLRSEVHSGVPQPLATQVELRPLRAC